jgi:heme-degrading monooxygenase HmoA
MADVRSMIRFQVKPGREAEFEAAFRRAGMLTLPRQAPGFVSEELCRSLEEASVYVVVARWTSEAAYRAWQQRSRDDTSAETAALLDTVIDLVPGIAYEILDEAAAGDGRT